MWYFSIAGPAFPSEQGQPRFGVERMRFPMPPGGVHSSDPAASAGSVENQAMFHPFSPQAQQQGPNQTAAGPNPGSFEGQPGKSIYDPISVSVLWFI